MATNPKPEHYVLSDLHLGHKNILGFCRPQFKTIEEHDECIIANINDICKAHDYLWLLGDIAFSKEALDKLSKVNCKMALVGGNHDHFSATTYLKYFNQIRGCAQMNVTGYPATLFTHIPMHPDQEARWPLNIHGHLHTHHVDDNKYINASCESFGFKPRLIGELLEEWMRRTFKGIEPTVVLPGYICYKKEDWK